MKMVNGSFVKERESLSCCDWFSMKLHEMMFRIKTFFDSDNNFHYGQRIKRRATYLLRTFIHIIRSNLALDYLHNLGPLNFCGKKSG